MANTKNSNGFELKVAMSFFVCHIIAYKLLKKFKNIKMEIYIISLMDLYLDILFWNFNNYYTFLVEFKLSYETVVTVMKGITYQK